MSSVRRARRDWWSWAMVYGDRQRCHSILHESVKRAGSVTPTPSDKHWSRELEVARAAAEEAAGILLARDGADEIREKEGRADLVTRVDEASERAIAARIRATFPDDAIVAEEFSGEARSAGRRWVVDPIDGTMNFVHGHPFACISIAFVDDDNPAVGVVQAPFLGEVYHAVRGSGAYLNGEPIRVSSVEHWSHSLLATGFPFKGTKGDPETYFRLVAQTVSETHGVRRAGAAALDLAYVAAGRLDGYFEIGLSPWDVAAGILLVQEAGGIATGWPGDHQPPIDTGRILATNGRIHDRLSRTVVGYIPPL
ncbi:MAG: inositol monophosphatase [Gemmatimonas sp.]|nr:inositol monophosphatase [Gemmatimonas sp.]